MTEIPKSVLKEARGWATVIDQRFGEDDRYVPWGDDIVIETIARAIIKEREKCARIAEEFDAWPQEGAHIAAAIRRGK